jgi:PAS domain S-box-containing protein
LQRWQQRLFALTPLAEQNQPPNQPEMSEFTADLTGHPPAQINPRPPAVRPLSDYEAQFFQQANASAHSIILHQQGQIRFINPAGANLLGAASPEQLIGQPIAKFIPSHPAVNHQETGQSAPINFMIESKLIRPDGTELEVELLETPFVLPNGLVTQLIIRDVTARKRVEAEMFQRNRALTTLQAAGMTTTSSLDLRHVLDTVTFEMTRLLGVESCILSEWNRAENSVTSLARYGLTGWADPQSPSKTQHLNEYPVTREVLEDQISEQMTIHQPNIDPAEFAYMERRNLKTRMLLPMIFKGQVLGLVELGDSREERIFTPPEISLAQLLANQAASAIENARLFERLEEERRLLAQRVQERTAELSRANAELAKAARLKDEFLAGMSHELRTPLNAIMGFAEILQNGAFGPLNEKQLKFSKNIEESGIHLLSLINDILDLSKIEAGKMDIEIGPVSIEAVCEASLRMVRELAHKKQLTVNRTLDQQVTVMQADERRLKQMLVNLLSNAVKFTPEGGQIGLEVTGNETEQVIHFTVWDNGIGIDPSDLSRLFQPFVQLDSRLTRQYSGTGLGLSLVSRMAELHGGGVAVESQVGQGSRFTISLPWDRAAAPAAYDRPEAGLPVTASIQNSNPYRILLADDNEEVINLFQDYLEAVGYQVIVARTGQEAVERAQEERPDLILMDTQMPGMDGLEATRRLRADAALATIPIISVTALAMPGDREQCLAAGANDYLSKPVNLEKMVRIIKTHLARQQGSRCNRVAR